MTSQSIGNIGCAYYCVVMQKNLKLTVWCN